MASRGKRKRERRAQAGGGPPVPVGVSMNAVGSASEQAMQTAVRLDMKQAGNPYSFGGPIGLHRDVLYVRTFAGWVPISHWQNFPRKKAT